MARTEEGDEFSYIMRGGAMLRSLHDLDLVLPFKGAEDAGTGVVTCHKRSSPFIEFFYF